MLERLSAPQRWLVGGAMLAGIILLATVALSRDIARRADTPTPPIATAVTTPAATPLPRPTPVVQPPAVDRATAGPPDWLTGLALALAGLAVIIAAASAWTSQRRLTDLRRRQTYPVLHGWLAWDADGDHLVVHVWNAGPGVATDLRCGLMTRAGAGDGPSPLTAYTTHPGLDAGQGAAIPFPALSRAALTADAGTVVTIVLAWRPATAGSEEISHHCRYPIDAIRAGVAPAWTDGRLAPHTITVSRDETVLPGQPRPTR